MKKIIVLITVICFAFVLGSCSDVKDVEINYGNSECYSKKDMDLAINEIIKEFKSWDGCKLYSLEYAGDDYCKEELSYCNSLREDKNFTECIIFDSSFRSPINGGGAWQPNEIYDFWSWILAREDDGDWELLTWGFG